VQRRLSWKVKQASVRARGRTAVHVVHHGCELQALEMKRLSRTKKLERRHCKVTARIRHKRLLNILIYDITYSLNSELDKYICHFDYMVLIHVFTLRSFCFSFAFQTPSNPGYICLNLESSCFLCRNLGMLSLGVPRNLIVNLFSL